MDRLLERAFRQAAAATTQPADAGSSAPAPARAEDVDAPTAISAILKAWKERNYFKYARCGAGGCSVCARVYMHK